MGWQMKDEPATQDFPSLKTWSDAVASTSPGALRFINILPNYATDKQLNATDYDDYVQRFVDEVQPDLLCMDAAAQAAHATPAAQAAQAAAAAVTTTRAAAALPQSRHITQCSAAAEVQCVQCAALPQCRYVTQ